MSSVKGARRKGFKGLSPRLVPEKFYIRVPQDIAQWLRQKAEEERKSYSVIITEALRLKIKADQP